LDLYGYKAGEMRINIKYLGKNDIFEVQVVDKKVRSHFLLTRAELNDLRTVLEKALLESKAKRNEN
jgi:hypothetical protein